MPAGFTDDGLPVGIQIVGRYRDDLDVLKIAHAFEQATGFGKRRPPGSARDEQRLDRIIAKQSPEMAKLTKDVLAKLRPRFPGAVELVYDKPRGMVLGFCADERASNVINSIGGLFEVDQPVFLRRRYLPDPEGLLQGERPHRHATSSIDDRRRSRSPGREGLDGRGFATRPAEAQSESEAKSGDQAAQAGLKTRLYEL